MSEGDKNSVHEQQEVGQGGGSQGGAGEERGGLILKGNAELKRCPGMLVQIFNLSSQEVEAGKGLSVYTFYNEQ